jgi:hypothetical protein
MLALASALVIVPVDRPSAEPQGGCPANDPRRPPKTFPPVSRLLAWAGTSQLSWGKWRKPLLARQAGGTTPVLASQGGEPEGKV